MEALIREIDDLVNEAFAEISEIDSENQPILFKQLSAAETALWKALEKLELVAKEFK